MPTGSAWLVKGYPYMSGFLSKTQTVKSWDVVSLSVPCIDPNIIEQYVKDSGCCNAFCAIEDDIGGCVVPPDQNGMAWDAYMSSQMPAWAMYYAVLLRRMGPGSAYNQWFFREEWQESFRERRVPPEFRPGGSGVPGVPTLRQDRRLPGNRIWSQPLSLP